MVSTALAFAENKDPEVCRTRNVDIPAGNEEVAKEKRLSYTEVWRMSLAAVADPRDQIDFAFAGQLGQRSLPVHD